MSDPLLIEYYDRLPQLAAGDDEDLWAAGVQDRMKVFRDGVNAKYTEGTLQRLLATGGTRVRRASALALGFVGTMASNASLAGGLKDDDLLVRRFASDGLWEIWFRAGTADENQRLQEALCQPDPDRVRDALDALVTDAPKFAEAYNQRAIVLFRRGDFNRAVSDCQAALKLNPFHYGAASGMGQCYLKLKKPRAALRAFRQALDLNPSIDNLHDTVRALQQALENNKRDERRGDEK